MGNPATARWPSTGAHGRRGRARGAGSEVAAKCQAGLRAPSEAALTYSAVAGKRRAGQHRRPALSARPGAAPSQMRPLRVRKNAPGVPTRGGTVRGTRGARQRCTHGGLRECGKHGWVSGSRPCGWENRSHLPTAKLTRHIFKVSGRAFSSREAPQTGWGGSPGARASAESAGAHPQRVDQALIKRGVGLSGGRLSSSPPEPGRPAHVERCDRCCRLVEHAGCHLHRSSRRGARGSCAV